MSGGQVLSLDRLAAAAGQGDANAAELAALALGLDQDGQAAAVAEARRQADRIARRRAESAAVLRWLTGR